MKFRAFLLTLLLPLCLQIFPTQAQDAHLVTRWAKEVTPDNALPNIHVRSSSVTSG